jgi:ferredoxin
MLRRLAETTVMLDIYVMGRRYQVPEGLTILTAMEYCGYRMVRGCGCRAGFCGACATIYRTKTDPQLRFDLACQKMIEPDMYLTQVPFFPAPRALYELENLSAEGAQIIKLFPDLVKCFGCNTCTKACPQDLEVMWYMSDALRGDIDEVANKSFDCVMCGLCAARCPQGLVPYDVALVCRRLRGRYLVEESSHLEERINEISSGRFDDELDRLKRIPADDIRRIYDARDIEPAY